MENVEIRILQLEDSESDAELIQSELKGFGLRCEWRRAQTREGFLAGLRDFRPDLVISDYALPSYDGLSALGQARQARPGIPFIFVTGNMGEDLAVESLKSGATDFVVKNSLGRLGPAVKRAMREVADAAERGKADLARAALQEQLHQSQRLESVGRLAGGIAHDFNNILTAIMGFSDFLLSSIPAGDPRREDVAEIVSAGQRAADLTRQLLAFSRHQVRQPMVLDVNVVVANFMKMLRRVIGEDVTLEFLPDGQACPVNVDGGQLEQVVMNLAVNARDAMPEGGRIVIATARVALGDDAGGTSPDLKPGTYAVLSVSDAGLGMDDETMKHIFDPFFTTKEPGKGTGLGLSTVHGIARQSGGGVTVKSAPGQGTTFKVWFPIVAAPSAPGPAKAPDTARPGGKETILILDDDSQVRKVIARVLGLNGYRTLEAATLQEALELCSRERGIDLFLSDVILSGGGRGPDVARRLMAMSPAMRVVFMSGYTDERISRSEILSLADAFMQKPVSPETLAVKVRAVLDAPRRGAA